MCNTCFFLKKHRCHKFIEISKNNDSKREIIQKDLQKLEKSSYPKLEQIASITRIPVKQFV